MKNHKLGLALSGGSTKGAFTAGALLGLDKLGILDQVTYAAGTSVGAINAAALTTLSADEIVDLYLSLEKRSDVFKATWWKFWHWKGLFSLEPLRKTLISHIPWITYKYGKEKIEAVAATVNQDVSVFPIGYFSNREHSYEEWFSKVMASATVPFLMEGQPDAPGWYDGGIREYVPVHEAARQCERVIVIQNSADDELFPAREPLSWWQKRIEGLVYGWRAVDRGMQLEIKAGDLLRACDAAQAVRIRPEKPIKAGT